MTKKDNFCQVWLTCANTVEADNIVNALLGKRLIACARQVSVNSNYLWQGKIEHNNEELIIMETKLELFDQIETEVRKLHSYDTFNLQAVPVTKVSKKAKAWLSKEFNG